TRRAGPGRSMQECRQVSWSWRLPNSTTIRHRATDQLYSGTTRRLRAPPGVASVMRLGAAVGLAWPGAVRIRGAEAVRFSRPEAVRLAQAEAVRLARGFERMCRSRHGWWPRCTARAGCTPAAGC